MATSNGAYAVEAIATEHAAANATEHGGQPTLPLPETVPISALLIQVAFNNGMWWTMPQELSTGILAEWRDGAQQVSFVWDWQTSREGSYAPDGATTSLNRYLIDFTTMHQRNIDNDRTRRVRVVHVVR